MLNADIVYASEDARFKLPEASLGVFVTGGLVATLPVVALLQAASLQPVPVGWGQISRRARLAGICSDCGAFAVTAYNL
jgi:hypothetical protein